MNHGWQHQSSDGWAGRHVVGGCWRDVIYNGRSGCSGHLTTTAGCSVWRAQLQLQLQLWTVLQCSSLQCSRVQCSLMQCSVWSCSCSVVYLVQYSSVACSVVQCSCCCSCSYSSSCSAMLCATQRCVQCNCTCRRKFGSHTFDNIDKCNSMRGERVRRKKMQTNENVQQLQTTVFFT